MLQFQNIEFVDDDCNAEEGNANAEKINNDDENDNGNHDNYDTNADGDNDNNGNANQARDAAAGAAPSAGKIASSSIVVDGSSSCGSPAEVVTAFSLGARTHCVYPLS